MLHGSEVRAGSKLLFAAARSIEPAIAPCEIHVSESHATAAARSTAAKRIMNIIGAASQSSDYLDVTANGGANVGVLALTAAGNLGIGTSSPYLPLSVAGSAVVGNNVTSSYFTATTTTATSSFAGGIRGGNGVFTVLQNGNVGVNTASPSSLLTAQYSFSGTNPLTVTDGTNAQANVCTEQQKLDRQQNYHGDVKHDVLL